jgi:hypothetical protein
MIILVAPAGPMGVDYPRGSHGDREWIPIYIHTVLQI